MILTRKQVEGLPNGTVLRVFMAGSKWDKDFGKVQKVIKVKDKLYNIGDFFNINEIDNDDKGYEIIVAVGDNDNA